MAANDESVTSVVRTVVDVAPDGRSFRFRDPVSVPCGCSMTIRGPAMVCGENLYANAGGQSDVVVTITRLPQGIP